VEEVVSNYWMRGKGKILKLERGRIRSHSVENSIWKKLWTCPKTGYCKKCR
jgi:hypothetical protein